MKTTTEQPLIDVLLEQFNELVDGASDTVNLDSLIEFYAGQLYCEYHPLYLEVEYDGETDRDLDHDLRIAAEKHGWKWLGEGRDVRTLDGKRDIGFVKPRKD